MTVDSYTALAKHFAAIVAETTTPTGAAAPAPFLETLPADVLNWVVNFLPDDAHWLRWFLTSIVAIVAILTVFGLTFAFLTVTERKLLGRFQNRYGPNRVRIFGVRVFGFFQPFADAVKALTKEDIVPTAADKVLHLAAPAATVAFSLLGFAVLPYGRHLTALAGMDAALLYFFAAGAASELAIFMAGWSSLNKYSLIAAMRALAQLISYELPLLLVAVPAVMVAGTLSLSGIVEAQGGWLGGVVPHWNIFTPWGFAGAIIFYIAALAECNRCPFDLPEGESEIIAGYLTEYSGFKYALFFMGEYFGMAALSGLGVALFLGGWQAPCEFLQFVPSYVWFYVKLVVVILSFMWMRATLLRLRMDQLMRLAWKCLVPLALVNLATVVFWERTAGWDGPALQAVRWLAALALVVVPFVLLGKTLSAGFGPRKYRYA
ncbi:MAG: NADH-quinone oxidoreductase subunit H [Puniceicoccales bacterium]|jgi:NADH-quinone oxidoreductase subunit H|nr:NADH-quinone oxidoreductase subunit H [Puniceicoccales bacterium]